MNFDSLLVDKAYPLCIFFLISYFNKFIHHIYCALIICHIHFIFIIGLTPYTSEISYVSVHMLVRKEVKKTLKKS